MLRQKVIKFQSLKMLSIKFCVHMSTSVSIHWTGLLDWNTGLLDWNTGLEHWTGILDWTTGLIYFLVSVLILESSLHFINKYVASDDSDNGS